MRDREFRLLLLANAAAAVALLVCVSIARGYGLPRWLQIAYVATGGAFALQAGIRRWRHRNGPPGRKTPRGSGD